MNDNIVYHFDDNEFAVLSELQGEVIKTIALLLRLHGMKFDPTKHMIDWASQSVVNKEASNA
jgi:hypothetical protein